MGQQTPSNYTEATIRLHESLIRQVKGIITAWEIWLKEVKKQN
jgi:hypothetical protein